MYVVLPILLVLTAQGLWLLAAGWIWTRPSKRARTRAEARAGTVVCDCPRGPAGIAHLQPNPTIPGWDAVSVIQVLGGLGCRRALVIRPDGVTVVDPVAERAHGRGPGDELEVGAG